MLRGDVLKKRDSGGLFVTDDRRATQPRVDAGEVVPTGPLPGGREVEPPEGTEARALEDEALAAVGVTPRGAAARRPRPARRAPAGAGAASPWAIPPLEPEAGDRLRLRFSLPAGGYATVVIEACSTDARRRPAVRVVEVAAAVDRAHRGERFACPAGSDASVLAFRACGSWNR